MIVDILAELKMLAIDMVKSFVPSFQTFVLECYNFLAKAAPEPTLAAPANAVFFALVPDNFILLNGVGIFQMSLKLFPAVEYLGALVNLATRIWFMAAPCLNLVVTSILVSLPVIFASKGLRACGESATIGTRMTLLVLPNGRSLIRNDQDFARIFPYLRSHRLAIFL